MIRLPLVRPATKSFLAGVVLCALAGVSGARELLPVDLRLLDELNARELFDYSFLHLDRMAAQYPNERDRILLARARTCYAARRLRDAEAAIAAIPKDSAYYPRAMLLMGEASYRAGRLQEAADAYAVYFRAGTVEKHLPDGQDADAVADFRRHVSLYKLVLERLGNLPEAQRIVGLLSQIRGGADERGIAFMQLRTALDVEETNLEQRRSVNRESLANTLAALNQLVFVRDGVGALAYIETARAHVLLGGAKLNEVVTNQELDDKKRQEELAKIRDFIEAIQILRNAGAFLEEMAGAQGGQEELLGGAIFQQGKALWGQALLMHYRERPDRAEPLLKAAAQAFGKVAAEFGDSRFQTPALAQHARCAQLAQSAYGLTLELVGDNTEGEMRLQLEQAMGFYQRREYGEAIPRLLQAARTGRRSNRLPTVVSPLVVAMGHEGYFLEAEALASYLVDVLPRDENTALCVLQLGASIREAAKKETDPVRRNALEDRAATVWEWFVDIAPIHSRAPMVAYAVAEQRYARAVDLLREADEPGEDQAERQARARQAMAAVAPAFRRVVDEYGTSEFAANALYNLAWSLYESGQRQEAATAFLRFAEDENLEAKFIEQRVQAKFRGAECILFGERPAEAVAHFRSLIAWLTPGGERAVGYEAPAASRLREAAAMNIGYAYDLAAEQLRPELNAMQEELRRNQRAIEDFEGRMKSYERQIAAGNEASEAAAREFAAAEQLCTGFELDFQESARRDAIAIGEDPDKVPPEMREQARANLRVEVDRLVLVKEQQARVNVAAEIAALEEAAAAVATQQRTLESDREALLGEIAELRRRLPRAEGGSEPEGKPAARLAVLPDLLAAETAAFAERNRALQEEQADKTARWERNEKEIADLEVKQRAFDERATILRDDVDAARDAAERTRLTAERDQAQASLRQTQEALQEAYGRRDGLTEDLAAARAAFAKAEAEFAAVAAESRRLAREARASVVRGEWLAARAEVVAKAKPFLERLAAVLALPAAGRAAQAEPLRELGRTALDAHRQVRDARIAVVVQEQATIRDLLAETKVGLEEARQTVAESQAALAPVKERFEGFKRQAVDAFENFLRIAGGDPENQARILGKLGTTYLELGDFAEAVRTLTRLAAEYPESPAGRGALFNLARAQFETGKHDEANASFQKILAEASTVSLANLQYIGRTMLEAGHAQTALAACLELLARSEQPAHPDHAQARAIRATSLFRAGLASLRTRQYPATIRYLETLLEENPRTGFFFDIKFATAEARRHLEPPDLAGALADLNDISFSNDMVQRTRADYLLGDMWAAARDPELVARGVNRLRLVIDLADPDLDGNLPWIEESILAAARGYARLGRAEERDAMVRAYRERFPEGRYLAELNNLPPTEFGN